MARISNPESFKTAPTRTILKKAEEVVTAELERSQILLKSNSSFSSIPRFKMKEFEIGRVLGRGGFGIVREITAIHLRNSSQPLHRTHSDCAVSDTTTVVTEGSSKADTAAAAGEQQQQQQPAVDAEKTRESLARIVYANKQRGAHKFVVKQAGEEILKTNKHAFLLGLIDLAMECKYLTHLDHPNIIKLRGCSHYGPFTKPSFFLVLDRLSEMLPQRLSAWSQRNRGVKGVTGWITGSEKKAKDLLIDRLLVAYDIASAMEYLHEKGMVYRDLKPDNVGFTEDGVTQLFDFGLARELYEEDRVKDDAKVMGAPSLYRMTGLCGAIRYMAPEVGLGKPYNQSADVYSFAMLLHYFIALEPPMGMFTPNMFFDSVFNKGYRPVTKDKWPVRLVQLLKTGWSSNIAERPSFLYIMSELREVVKETNPHALGLLPPM